MACKLFRRFLIEDFKIAGKKGSTDKCLCLWLENKQFYFIPAHFIDQIRKINPIQSLKQI